MKEFDIFRLNCFLNDTEANDFKRIIISLVSEFIFDNNNKEQQLDVCYNHLVNYHKLEIEKDYFINIISNYKHYEQISLQNDVLIKLSSKKFGEINDRLNEHSIEIYIERFLKKKNLPLDLIKSIKEIIHQSVYENISTFSTENLSSLISENLNSNFSNEEINIFNDFLEDNDNEKNTALYNIFLKATEFAIITSGKGVKEFSKDIFKGKRYCLDTNILFRLLGIGGVERQNTLKGLIKSCNHQGITFEFTPHTYQELTKTLKGSVKYLKFAEKKYDLDMLGELTETDPQIFKEDFITHYSKLKSTGQINNPDQYELKMLSNFRNLQEELSFGITKGNIILNDKEQNRLSEYFYKSKKDLPYGTKYTKTAANIDAYNILHVRKLRGENNYNYIDVKSFYLTTDRTLNVILSKDSNLIIPETILPSQLFILHHPYMSNGEEVDYELFLQFVKRRTTEFHFKGGEVLTFINQIRTQTSSKEELRNILTVYADKRYEDSSKSAIEERKVKPLQEIIDTVLDKKIQKGEEDGKELSLIKSNAEKEIIQIHNSTRTIIRTIDIIFTIILIPISIIVFRKFIDDFKIIIGLTLLIEVLKFLITSKTNIWNISWKYLLNWRLTNSNYFKLTNDISYIEKGFINYNKVDGEIWKKVKNHS